MRSVTVTIRTSFPSWNSICLRITSMAKSSAMIAICLVRNASIIWIDTTPKWNPIWEWEFDTSISKCYVNSNTHLQLSNFPSFLAKVYSMQDGDSHGIKNRRCYFWDSEPPDIPMIIWTLWHGTTWMTTISLRTILRRFQGLWFHCIWDTTPAKTLHLDTVPEFANLGTLLETRLARLESQWNVPSNDSPWIVHMNDSNPTIWTRLNWLKYSNFRQLLKPKVFHCR